MPNPMNCEDRRTFRSMLMQLGCREAQPLRQSRSREPNSPIVMGKRWQVLPTQ